VLNPVTYDFPEDERKRTTPSRADSLAQAAAMAEIHGNVSEAEPSDESNWWVDTPTYIHRGPTFMIGAREDISTDEYAVSMGVGETIGGPVYIGTTLRDMGCWFGTDAETNVIAGGRIALGPQIKLKDSHWASAGPCVTIAIDTDSPNREITATEHLVLLRNTELDYFIEPIVDRIQHLANLAAEEGDDQQGLRQESLSAFLKFLYIHKDRIHNQPSIILTADGNLRAEWRNHSANRVAVEFLSDNRVMFVSFLPDSKNPAHTNRVAGAAGLKSFFESTAIRDL